jgi:hypothetical protein
MNMANITKLELQQRLAVIGAEVQALRLQVSQLTVDNERLRTPRFAPRAQKLTPADKLPAHFVIAREKAMVAHIAVQVQP